MRLERTIEWKPFTEKHKQYIKNAQNNALNVAEGAIRSGKTIDNCIIAAMYLETCEDTIHLASGSSQPNAKLNIGACNGFGLENLFRGRCKWGKFKGNEALYIKTKTGEKVVIFVGGGKADSYKKILGNSYGLWIATEINEHYDSDNSKESFVKVAQGRQLAAKKPLTLWDLNPSKPNHPIYTDYIDKWIGNYPGGYQYQHFTIYDNGSLSADRIKEIEQKYEKGSIWYKRDILGQRVQAEGLVFPYFAENKEKFIIKAEDVPKHFEWCEVGFDIGGNGSAYALTCTGYTGGKIYVLKSEKKQAADLEMSDILQFVNNFCEYCIHRYGVYIQSINCDHVDIVKNTINERTQYRAGLCYKPPLDNRPIYMSQVFAEGRIFFVEGECEDLTDELQNLVFDEKSDRAIPLDDGTMQIDTWDSFIYSISGNWSYLDL